MPITAKCPHCDTKFKAPSKYAGQRVKCPSCKETMKVPAADGAAGGTASKSSQPAAAGSAGQRKSAAKPATNWYITTSDGEEFGPTTYAELEEWLAEGRIDAECQLLEEGWEEWKWAPEVFPELNGQQDSPPEPDAAAADNPFAAMGVAGDADTDETDNPFAAPTSTSYDAGGHEEEYDAADGIPPGVKTALAQTAPWVLMMAILGCAPRGLRKGDSDVRKLKLKPFVETLRV